MIIEHFGNLPKFNCVIKIINDVVHIVGTLTNLEFPNFIVANNLKPNETFFIHWDEIQSLSIAVNNITICTNEVIELYQKSIESQQKFTYIDMLLIENKTIGCIPPYYRCKPPLKFNLNNSQMILVLCDEFTRNNFETLDGASKSYDIKDIQNQNGTKYESIFHRELNLLPQHFAQGKNTMQLNCVFYGLPVAKQPTLEYRPAREMSPPAFLSGNQRYTRQFDRPPPYSIQTPRREKTPPPQTFQQFNPQQQQFEAHQSGTGLSEYQGVNIGYSITPTHTPPPPGFFPNFPQNIPSFCWVPSDTKPFFTPLY